jgi:hypothetical protein
MKRVFLNLTIFIFITCFQSLFSCCQQPRFESCDKQYVQPNYVAVSEDGIFIQLQDKWIQTEGVFSDAQGLFILNLAPSAYGCQDPYVPCRNCKKCIYEVYDICPHCGKNA